MDPASAPASYCEESRSSLRLLMVDGIGHARLRALRSHFGSAQAALDAPSDEFARALGVDLDLGMSMQRAGRQTDPSDAIEALCFQRFRAVLEQDAGFPQLLLASHDPPAILFAAGELEAEPEAAVAIVGSRRATAYGRLHAGALAVALAERGVTVVSGGARGIDLEAHRGAMRAGGRTIAVLATGCARPYPDEHAELYETIAESGGCTLTEQPPFVLARPDLFPRRNRIIAALSLVTVVVEAAERSGALLTARIAVDDLGREAGCLPGRVDSPTSAGCHRAIREGWAQLVTSAEDVCALLESARSVAHGAVELGSKFRGGRRPRAPDASPIPVAPKRPLSADAAAVLAAIRKERRAGLDELERLLEWPVSRLACATLELEMSGAVGRDAEGAFVACGM